MSNGAKQCITQAVLAVCSPGDEVKLSSNVHRKFLGEILSIVAY